MCTLVTLCALLTRAAPTSQPSDLTSMPGMIHHKRHKQAPFLKPFLDVNFDSDLASSFVSFSAHKPSAPPFLEVSQQDFDSSQVDALLGEHKVIGDGADDGAHLRIRRSLPEHMDHLVRPVCESISEWVRKYEAEDMWGNTFTVLQEIDVGGTRVNQFFYETRCRRSNPNHSTPPSCTGIDNERFSSMCLEKYIWVYAKVVDNDGNIGWTLVKNAGSCNCGVVARTRGNSLGIDLG